MRTLAFLICCLILIPSFAQRSQSEYLEAKRQFGLGNYKAAKIGFQELSRDLTFGAYASFYYALTAYHLDEMQLASQMWKQVKAKYPNWDQNEEVNFWLAVVAFETGRYNEGIEHAKALPAETNISLVHSFMKDVTYEKLMALHEANPQDKQIALYLAKELVSQPYGKRDNGLLQRLTSRFKINVKTESSSLPLIKKENYSIALVLPFMFVSLERPQSVIRNRIIFDLYQGMVLAREDLEKDNINVSLFPYDTKKKEEKTRQIVNSGLLKSADVIIGPLYDGPNEVIGSFSINNKTPCINPLSSNGNVVADNPYAFLFKPSYVTQGKATATYAIENFDQNKNAFVFFENARDEIVATAYKGVIEEAGFNVVKFGRLTAKNALKLQMDFTKRHAKYYDGLEEAEIDSILGLPNRFIQSKPARDRDGKIMYDEEGEEVLRYYEMQFNVKKSSIGHIFAATSNNLLANNMISMIDIRGDGIGLIGYDSWLDFELISYRQLERLGVSFINTSYFKEGAKAGFSHKVKEKYHISPSEYHKLGYELIMQLGHLLDKHGKYFQQGFRSGKKYEGYLMEGIQYGPYNDNQVVPVVTIEDYKLKARNIGQDEDK